MTDDVTTDLPKLDGTKLGIRFADIDPKQLAEAAKAIFGGVTMAEAQAGLERFQQQMAKKGSR